MSQISTRSNAALLDDDSLTTREWQKLKRLLREGTKGGLTTEDVQEIIDAQPEDKRLVQRIGALRSEVTQALMTHVTSQVAHQNIISKINELQFIASASYDWKAGRLVLTERTGHSINVPIAIERVTKMLDYDPKMEELVIFSQDGGEIRVNIADIVNAVGKELLKKEMNK